MSISNRQQQIISALLIGSSSLPELIKSSALAEVTGRTLQRDLNELIESGFVTRQGEARAVIYSVSARGRINVNLPADKLQTIFGDENRPHVRYDFGRLPTFETAHLFTDAEVKSLSAYNSIFIDKLKTAPADIIKRERERITIELS
jgi:hypothetical protein